ncbi:MAG: antitoxin family protein [Chloroflexi bacterium]|nr:antitoxin family protein [Chloroflexota bacterium]
MATLRLRYENGRFTPIGSVPDLEEGQEIEVVALTPSTTDAALQEMLQRSRGAWADWPNMEDLLSNACQKWTQAWRDDPARRVVLAWLQPSFRCLATWIAFSSAILVFHKAVPLRSLNSARHSRQRREWIWSLSYVFRTMRLP